MAGTQAARRTGPSLIIVDVGTGYLVIDGNSTKMYGKTPYTKLKFGVCKGELKSSFAGFEVCERDNSVVLSNSGRSVPVAAELQKMAEGFLNGDAEILQKVWESNMEKVRRLFS
ncbi:MAG: hypothetical protein OK441_06510 [Thaumarchaeota archaeon]|nr:hypothetical protein [Nitrososphaerota archaeon]